MTAVTTSVHTSGDVYQLAAERKDMVRLQIDGANPVRVHVGPCAPDAGTDNYFLVARDILFEGLGEDDNVYVRSDVIPQTVRVIAWTLRAPRPNPAGQIAQDVPVRNPNKQEPPC